MPKITAYVVRESKYEFEIPDGMTSEDEEFTDLLYEAIGTDANSVSYINQAVTAYDNGTQVY